MINGIDVSSYQGDVNWPQVLRDGYGFGIPKATEGIGYTDGKFHQNWSGLAGAGMVRGAYHFSRPDLTSPEAEADWFLQVIGPLSPGDFLALDLEAGGGDQFGWALTWLNRVYSRTGVKPFWYSYSNFIETRNLRGLFNTDYGFWAVNPRSDYPPCAMLQLLAGGYIGDTDQFFGTLDQLRAYGLPAAPQPKPHPPLEEEMKGVRNPADGAEYVMDSGWRHVEPGEAEALRQAGVTFVDLVDSGGLTVAEIVANLPKHTASGISKITLHLGDVQGDLS